MTTPDLKPCPFCGGEASMRYACGEYFVLCKSCSGSGMIANAEKKAAEAWNRRANDETPSRNPEDCLYYTANSFWGGGCLGTKEIDQCKGAECENWEPKEDKR